jgi:hypothetical protein
MAENRYTRRSQQRERVHDGSAPRATLSRLRFLLLAFLAVAIQVFVVQTHVHVPQDSSPAFREIAIQAATAVSTTGLQTASLKADPVPNKNPFGDDTSNCPVCQQIAHSNHFVQGAALLASLPGFIAAKAIPKTQAALSSVALTHIWKSRAPPSVR